MLSLVYYKIPCGLSSCHLIHLSHTQYLPVYMSLQPGTRLPSSLPDSADSDDGWTSIDAVFDYEQQAVVLEVIAAPIEPTVIFQGDTISDALNWAVNVLCMEIGYSSPIWCNG